MQIFTRVSLLTTLLAVGALAAPASAQTLYGASNGTPGSPGPSDFYTLNPETGEATLVGPTGFENVTGFACLPDGRLVASARGDTIVPPGPSAILIEIEPDTGAGSLIGTIIDFNDASCGRMPGLTYDSVTGTLFGYADFCNGDPEGLFTVDPDTGAGTSVGASGYTGGGNGLAADASGTLYATPFDFNSLVVIDPDTGAGQDVLGSSGNVPFRVNALDFHPASGVLYGSLNDPFDQVSSLVTINISDGTTTIVGPTVLNLDAIAFECEPVAEPEVPTAPASGGTALIVLAVLLAAGSWILLSRQTA